MVDVANYCALPLFKWVQSGFIPTKPDGQVDTMRNWLHGGPHFNQIYECRDKKWASVQAMEPKFYANLLQGLGLSGQTLPEQLDKSAWGWMRERFVPIFKTRTRDEWAKVFWGVDAQREAQEFRTDARQAWPI